MIVLNSDLLWEEEQEPLVPLLAKDAERRRAPGVPAQAESLSARLHRTAGNAALAREVEAAGSPRRAVAAPALKKAPGAAEKADVPAEVARAAPAPAAKERDAGPAAGTRPAGTQGPITPAAAALKKEPLPPAAGHHDEAALEAAARKPVPPGTTPETEAQARAAALAAAFDRVMAAFTTDPEAADLLGLARLAEGVPEALARTAADALARAAMRANVEHRAAIARRLALDLRPHPDLRLARLLAGLMAGVMTPPPAPAVTPPPPPPPSP
jgi:hypothetical protein